MMKIWGRNTSSNVQKVMWTLGELGLDAERIDVGGAFGKNDEPPYRAMNPNGLVPTLEEDNGFLLWESNSIVRYLAGKFDQAGVLEPKDPHMRARASQWMDWQLSVCGPGIVPAFWQLIRTPPEKRDMAVVKASKEKSIENFAMLETQLGKTPFVAGDAFSYGDIPVGVMCYRFVQIVPERPKMPNLDRWYAAISSRKAFKDQVGSVPLS